MKRVSTVAVACALRLLARTGRRGTRLATRLARRIPARFLVGHVRAERLGVEFDLSLTDNVQRRLFLTGWYERDFLEFLSRELRAGDTFLDVGAHIGIHSLWGARALQDQGGGRVIAFEPSPDSASALEAASERAGLDIHVVRAGLASRDSRRELRGDPEFPAADASVRSLHNDGPVVATVPMVRFDNWADASTLTRLDVVKVDIEGGEFDALVGMKGSLRRLRPRVVVVEVGARRLRQAGRMPSDIDAVLADCGFAPSGERFLENVVYRGNGGSRPSAHRCS